MGGGGLIVAQAPESLVKRKEGKIWNLFIYLFTFGENIKEFTNQLKRDKNCGIWDVLGVCKWGKPEDI